MPQKPILLIVDDEERNIRLLKAMLMAKNYDLLEASGGEEAFRVLAAASPDMILLDVMMPKMDGFEVCRLLKAEEKTRHIPVIMVTALSERQHRIKAMEVGADDFLTKPVDLTELTIRVKSLLRIKSYHDELFKSYQEISSKNAALEDLQKTKDGLTHMIVHDLQNPLTAISSYLQLASMEAPSLSGDLNLKMNRCLHFCKELERLIQNLLDINKMEEKGLQLHRENTSLETLINGVNDQFRATAEEKGISLGFSKAEPLPDIPFDPGLIKRVFANLLSNALRHTPKNGTILTTVAFGPERKSFLAAVRDNGMGLPPEYHQKIFDKFEQVRLKNENNVVGSSGLGLTFCKLAVEAHGGKIWVESEGKGKGCTFWVQLPILPQEQS